MSGVQTNFSDSANPMSRWRTELTDMIGSTFSSGCFPSARTGSDWHGGSYPGYVTSLSITFKPVQSGIYTLVVYRDNKAQSVFSWTGDYAAGTTYNLSGSFSFSTSGQHYYYLYVDGLSDYIYSSPIFLSN
ncbi:MAG TPA: hypothetical protein VGL40_13740 [Bacillota bacterium]|jgi:hypothetical protein